MKRWLPVVFAVAVVAGVAAASSIKNWSSGDALTSTDLNANFNHIHNTMVGGHGTRLTNADVSPTAAIAVSKLATSALIPVAVATVSGAQINVPCVYDAGYCPLFGNAGVTNVYHTDMGNGVYNVDIPARTDANYNVLITARTQKRWCSQNSAPSTTTFNVVCYDETGTQADSAFTFLVTDNN